jgi:transposase
MEQNDKTVQPKPTYDELLFKVTQLEQELAQYRRMIFGQKSERFVPVDEKQIPLPGFSEPSPRQRKTETISYLRRKKEKAKPAPHGRNLIPAHLPRTDVIIEPEEDISGYKKIGEEITETLEIKQPRLYVTRTIRPKYARPDGEGVVIAPMPAMPIPKCQAGASLLTHILVGKFVDHVPFHRQRQQFKRIDNIDIPASTLDGWFKATCALLEPLGLLMRQMIAQSTYLQADETPLRVQDPQVKGKCHTGYMWPYFAPVEKICLFDYQTSRGGAGPASILKHFAGTLQTDGYNSYDQFESRSSIVLLGCFAHARRYFEKALVQDKERATWVLETIQKLYDVEREAREAGLSFTDRHQLRQEKAAPVLTEIKTWLDENGTRVLPASLIGKAINYTMGMWPRLERYISHGRYEIDNNLVENAIRPIALGRKNYLFAGSHEAAQNAALIYSMMATAKFHDVNPSEYLKFVIENISDYPYHKLADLLPQNWKNRTHS